MNKSKIFLYDNLVEVNNDESNGTNNILLHNEERPKVNNITGKKNLMISRYIPEYKTEFY